MKLIQPFTFILSWIAALILGANAYSCTLRPGESIPKLTFPPKYRSSQPSEDYMFKVIQLVLAEAEDKYGPCQARLLDRELPLRRMMRYLEKNITIDAIALTASSDFPLRPIKIPVAKGLVGLRLFIIRKGEQNRFNQVNTVSDLRAFVAGQGAGWPDTEILDYNGLPTVTSSSTPSLARMLAAGRFDYFPRGARELITEMKVFATLPLQIESKLILSYPGATTFYVNHSRNELAERLEYGLSKAISSGRLDELFYSHPTTSDALKKLDIDNRTLLKICNSIIPEWVPVNNPKYWLFPWPKDLCDNPK